MEIKHGTIVLLSHPPVFQQGQSIRTIGTIVSLNPVRISYKGATLDVDNSKLVDVSFTVGTLFQFIGEMGLNQDKWVLHARVARNIDGLDTELYEQALQVRNQF